MSQPNPTSAYALFVGIDIAAKTFTMVWQLGPQGQPSPARTFDQTAKGFAQACACLQHLPATPAQTLVVMEASGSYWIKLATTLQHKGYGVSVANPHRTHHYAQSLGQRRKSDPVDARLLSQYAADRQPEVWTPPPAIAIELRHRLHTRQAMQRAHDRLRNQLDALEQWPQLAPELHARWEQLLAELAHSCATLEKEIEALLLQGPWAHSAELLLTIPGIGPLTTGWLLVTTCNFSCRESAQSFVAYAGLAPMERESGTSLKLRPCIGHSGNKHLRTALYMAALSAMHHYEVSLWDNPALAALYERLRAAGKLYKVARCAVARKLLVQAYAVVRSGQPFDRQRATEGQSSAA